MIILCSWCGLLAAQQLDGCQTGLMLAAPDGDVGVYVWKAASF